MLVFPNCKINLGLHILNKREDNYHNIETVFYPVPVYDMLEVLPAADKTEGVNFSFSGSQLNIPTQDNLCIKAYNLLKKDFSELPPVKMHLHKTIPLGSGLGGGSADGTFTLKLLNEKFNLGIDEKKMLAYSLQLGSDCPFFIINKPCYATGRGEMLEPVSINLSGYFLVIVNPGIHINTGWAFNKSNPVQPSVSVKEIIKWPVEEWNGLLQNDFEEAVFNEYAPIKKIKEELYNLGAVYASMSGSGSSIYGLFKNEISFSVFEAQNYFTKFVRL